MKLIHTILPSLIVLILACEDGNEYIFWISEPDGQRNDFLFIAESTNIPEIAPDSLVYYLTQEELVSAEKSTFKNFGKIHSDDRFDVYVLLKEGNGTGREYSFLIRTFDKDFRLVDSYELASWLDSENRHCFGSIDKDLLIKRNCADGQERDVRQIMNDGRMVATSFYQGD